MNLKDLTKTFHDAWEKAIGYGVDAEAEGVKAVIRALYPVAFVAGFEVSAEGFNGEYPFGVKKTTHLLPYRLREYYDPEINDILGTDEVKP